MAMEAGEPPPTPDFPKSNRFVLPPRGQSCSVGRYCYYEIHGGILWNDDWRFACANSKYFQFCATPNEVSPIGGKAGREDRSAMQQLHFLVSLRIPYFDALIPAGCGDPLPIRMIGQRPD